MTVLPTVGSLRTVPAADRPDLLAPATDDVLRALPWAGEVGAAVIDPAVADTAALVAAHGVPAAVSANCVVVSGRREGVERVAACLVLATTRADVNGLVRRLLDVRKASFLPMERAVADTGMEYGGITPIGLPAAWSLLVDARVVEVPVVVIGSGVRRSKLVLPGGRLADLPGAQVVADLGLPL